MKEKAIVASVVCGLICWGLVAAATVILLNIIERGA
jgi:hypothetical protein